MLSHNFKNLLKRNGIECCGIKVVFGVFVFIFTTLRILGSQLFLQIGFLIDFGSQKKRVEKRCSKQWRSQKLQKEGEP